ncbi:conjugal transfer protein TrbI [Sphingomonas sp. Root50]|uniref:TrbI/VirB10 family protein n=1 Tax=Sphingomonas sp. Root50 TaxID=1736551 RepID=UPI0006FA8694|nr:conjugal transfer protein TrbI [Sphingomonas sp. Root1294]KQY65394.1 conjugal transfer protein TrbI [Sphingomonas sp. Root50]KRB95311.1 conjugal transfer protein TrbI [Sphingomonas sp. Root720]
MTESDVAAAPQTKLDPETLAIRSRPQRAIRFKRGLIIGIAAAGSASLMVIAWVALKPPVFNKVSDQTELSEPDTRQASDALNGLPSTYGDTPKLGPPLPGDLGRPILNRQRELEAPGVTGPTPSQSAAAEEWQRRLADIRAARQSPILVQSGSHSAEIPAAPGSGAAPAASEAAQLAIDPTKDPNGQQTKADFQRRVDRGGDINPHALMPAASPYLVSAGSVIAASLITGLNSDLPGLVTAQISQNVYDSPTGSILLIPQGARLVGSYDSVVAFGQKRALVVWQRIIWPDGSSMQIDNAPATDPSGYAGLVDKVDFHTWMLLKGVVLSTLLGVSSQLALSGQSDLVQAIRESTQDNVARAGDQITQRNLGVQPTITIRPGGPVRLLVHKDLILSPWKAGGPNA